VSPDVWSPRGHGRTLKCRAVLCTYRRTYAYAAKPIHGMCARPTNESVRMHALYYIPTLVRSITFFVCIRRKADSLHVCPPYKTKVPIIACSVSCRAVETSLPQFGDVAEGPDILAGNCFYTSIAPQLPRRPTWTRHSRARSISPRGAVCHRRERRKFNHFADEKKLSHSCRRSGYPSSCGRTSTISGTCIWCT
jgi:hypothetical protein